MFRESTQEPVVDPYQARLARLQREEESHPVVAGGHDEIGVEDDGLLSGYRGASEKERAEECEGSKGHRSLASDPSKGLAGEGQGRSSPCSSQW